MNTKSGAQMYVGMEYDYGTAYSMDASIENKNDMNTDGSGVTNICPSNENAKVKVFVYSEEQKKYLRRVREYAVSMMNGIIHGSADSIECRRKIHNTKNCKNNMKSGEYMWYKTNICHMMGLFHLSLEQGRVSECVTQDSGLRDLTCLLHNLNMGICFTTEQTTF